MIANGNTFRLRLNANNLVGETQSGIAYSANLVSVTKGISNGYEEVIPGVASASITFNRLYTGDETLTVGQKLPFHIGPRTEGQAGECIIEIQADLDAKTDVTQAQIIGRNIVLNGKSINVPSTIGGLQDDRIPSTVVVGEYLQFDTTGGGISNITGDTLKGNIGLNLVNNTADISKPVSGPQQSALDLKVDTSTYNTGQAAQDTNINTNATDIATNATAIALNTQKVSFDAVSSAKLAGIEALADVTDTENVWGSLGISGSGSTGQYLTQRGVFVGAPNVSVNKSQIDAAIGASPGGNTTLFYNQAGAFTAPEGGDDVTKQAIDNAIGVFPSGDSAQFYNEQGNFIDAVYDSVEDAPIIRNRTIESIVLSGTRSNVQARLTGVSELSIITMQNTFDSSPTQYTTTFTSPNTTFTPSLVFPAGSQGRQLSLTEADGTLHRFCYLVNGNYRLLAGGLTGTVRLGPVAVATTATVTAAVTVPDQTAGQTITLAGDETGTFAVGDFISPQANNFGAYRGIFIESVTLNGGNTDIVGTSNGATTFNTTSVLRNAGPATEIQGTIPTFSGDPDTANTVYSSSIPATEFTVLGVNTSAHLIQVANAYAALETAITTDGIVTDNGDGTSSITVNYNTETNIDSSFTITGGLNNMESIVNVDGTIGPLSPATTITVIDPEATEVASFTSSAADTSVNNVDDIAAQIVTAVNNNTETPIDFTAEYDAATTTLVLTATEAGNTNPWTIVFNNNGTTGVNAGDLGYTSSQTGQIVNQMEALTVMSNRAVSLSSDSRINLISDNVELDVDNFSIEDSTGSILNISSTDVFFNGSAVDRNFIIRRLTSGSAYSYNAGNDNTLIESDVVFLSADTSMFITAPSIIFNAASIVGLPTGADGLSITDTVNLNLLNGTDVLSTVVLPSSSGTTVIAGTANEIINTVSGDTNTLSLAPAITDAITANTAKTGITTEQAAAITSNTGKTGITVEQSNAIIANTAKTGITTAQATAITDNTAKNSYPTADATKLAGIEALADVTDTTNVVGSLTAGTNITISAAGVIAASGGGVGDAVLANNQTFTGTNTFNNNTTAGGVSVNRITAATTSAVSIDFSSTQMAFDVPIFSASGVNAFLLGGTLNLSASIATFNPLNGDRDFEINKQTTGKAFVVDAGADTMTIGSDVLTINSTTINGLPDPTKAQVDTAIGTGGATTDYYASDKTWKTIPSGGTATTVLGTTGEIDVNTVGSNATVSLDTAITDAIDLNTAKVSVAGLNQVGAAVLSTDSVVYYAGTALAPRRKTFSLVPLSIMNNDSGFTTNTGTVTSVTGTANQINVVNGTTTPVVSLNNTITSAITANTAKITYPTSASNKLATIETNADVTDKANVDTAIGASAGGDAALFYNQQGAFVAAGGGGGNESGTWTPVLNSAGTTSGLTGSYSKTGDTVQASFNGFIDPGPAGLFTVDTSSFPFAPSTTVSLGIFTTNNSAITAVGVMNSLSMIFWKPDGNPVTGDELTAVAAMNITYQTT